MLYTIEDLAKGNVALSYNEVNLEGLRKVLKLAFPTDSSTAYGRNDYYMREPSSIYNKNGWKSFNNKVKIPHQSLDLFLKQLEKPLYTIEDLSNGKVQLYYNEKNLEGLEKVIKLCFPTDSVGVRGTLNYYKQHSFVKGDWEGSNLEFNNIPTQPLEDFLKQLKPQEEKEPLIYSIEDLSNGKVWLEGIKDTNTSLEDFRKVLCLAFPNNSVIKTLEGSLNYYKVDDKNKTELTSSQENRNNMPTQATELFLMNIKEEKIYTIEDLGAGTVILDNCGNKNETGLYKVMEMAFPDDKTTPAGSNFYYRSKTMCSKGWEGGSCVPRFGTDLPTQKLEVFIEQLNKKENIMAQPQTTDNRFPFTLKPGDAQRIIHIACSGWKSVLFEKWGQNIVFDKNSTVSEEEYKMMRKECTKVQHELFNTIFGKDIEKVEWIPGKVYEIKSNQSGAIYYRRAYDKYLQFYCDGSIDRPTSNYTETKDYSYKIIN